MLVYILISHKIKYDMIITYHTSIIEKYQYISGKPSH